MKKETFFLVDWVISRFLGICLFFLDEAMSVRKKRKEKKRKDFWDFNVRVFKIIKITKRTFRKMSGWMCVWLRKSFFLKWHPHKSVFLASKGPLIFSRYEFLYFKWKKMFKLFIIFCRIGKKNFFGANTGKTFYTNGLILHKAQH